MLKDSPYPNILLGRTTKVSPLLCLPACLLHCPAHILTHSICFSPLYTKLFYKISLFQQACLLYPNKTSAQPARLVQGHLQHQGQSSLGLFLQMEVSFIWVATSLQCHRDSCCATISFPSAFPKLPFSILSNLSVSIRDSTGITRKLDSLQKL